LSTASNSAYAFLFHLTPCGVSSRIIPRAARSSRIWSALAKSRFFLASVRCWINASISLSKSWLS